ncbi:MAG TPA: VWA domain-containing protein [Thermoanaerobaculia bacterium]|jgi:VWFA-related protein|nr:VWA domain-containing protein [Thermoanaerobaculia bacterium]
MSVVLRRRVLGASLPLLAGLLTALPAIPQEPPLSSFQDEVSVGLVLVPVVVRAGEGYAKNLDQEDFRLSVEGKPVAIESFERRSDAPASVVVLQDLSGSMASGSKLEMSRDVVRFFLDKALSGDEFSVATFAGDQLQVEVPFTSEQGVVRESIGKWEAYGTTALHDAVANMPRISLEGRNPKRFAILVTDGVDNASRLTPEQARFVVQQAQLPTYVLGMGSGSPYELSTEGKKIYRYADVLSLLAAVTGGRYYSINGTEDLQTALTAILDDVRHQYVLGFSTGDGAVKFRPLKVEVKNKAKDQQTIVFRRGYKGTPPARLRAGG